MSGGTNEMKTENDTNGQQDNQTGHNSIGRGGGRGGRNRFSGPGGRNRDDSRGGMRQDVKSENNMEGEDPDGQGAIGRGMGGAGGRGRGNRFRGGGGGAPREEWGMRNQDDRLNERLSALSAPTHDLPPQDIREKKFTGRCRLYIGNLTNDVTEEEINELFRPYGETAELFVNKEKNFAFIRLDYRANAEKAKRELDGQMRKGRALKVRFAPHSAAVKVKNLTPWVSNELLEKAFSVFGEIERAVIIVDERGKSMGEGIIEFARKPGAQMALRRCNEGCFFLTASLRPVVLEPFEQLDDVDGYAEKNLPKKNPEYYKARDIGPRFAAPGSFEYEYGTRWKQLHELYKQKEEALTREMKMEEEKLEAQMEYARYEHETEILREQLRQRELDRERQKREWEMKERQAEEQRLADEERMRRQQEEMQLRMHHQEEELRRRQQENTLFMQAHQLSSLLDQQEQALRQTPAGYDSPGADAIRDYDAVGGAVPGSIPPDPKSFMDAYDRGGSRYESGGRGDMREDLGGPNSGGPRGSMGGNRGRWGPERRGADDYPNLCYHGGLKWIWMYMKTELEEENRISITVYTQFCHMNITVINKDMVFSPLAMRMACLCPGGNEPRMPVIPTFLEFLRDIESPYEVKNHIRLYLGEGKEVQEFAKQFLERRSKWRSAQKAAPLEDDMCVPAPAVNPLNMDFQEVKGKSKKTKKSKMFRVDNRILGFNVTAAQDRINVGDRDYGEM